MIPPSTSEPASKPSTYLISGDEACTHETQFLGSDMASNRYYRCERCGGSIVQEGQRHYGDGDGGPSGEADRAALEELVKRSDAPPSSGGSIVQRLRSYLQ